MIFLFIVYFYVANVEERENPREEKENYVIFLFINKVKRNYM